MSDACYIGIDLGTTGVKVGAFDVSANMIGLAHRGFVLDQPAPGFAEFQIDAYYASFVSALRDVLSSTAERGYAVGGFGLSSQAQTFVLLDEQLRPIRPAVSWLDVRATREAGEMNDLSVRLTGNRVDAVASGPKILWIARHEPGVFERCRHVALLPDYLSLRLTGRRVTGLRSAESTGCYDLKQGRWVEPLLEFCHLNLCMVPDVAPPCEIAGRLLPETAAEFGLPAGIPVAVGAMDHLAGAIGTGNATTGIGSAALGTALAVIAGTDREPAAAAGVAVRPHPVEGLHALLSYSKTAGIVLDWCRDRLAPDIDYEKLLSEASTIPPGSDGVMCFPHFAGMASPTFDPDARGAFVGLALNHRRAHLMRAVIESLSFLMRENVERLSRAGGEIRVLRVTGGGATSDFWLQTIADACGIPVERPKITEAPCFGAAQFGMVAAKEFASVAEASQTLYKADRVFVPQAETRQLYDALHARYLAMHNSLYGASE